MLQKYYSGGLRLYNNEEGGDGTTQNHDDKKYKV